MNFTGNKRPTYRFKHPTTRWKTRHCIEWIRTGTCRFGSTCKFTHLDIDFKHEYDDDAQEVGEELIVERTIRLLQLEGEPITEIDYNPYHR
jgi:Zinc finger C-x8-C-x5-C-x3-H type (and similar)